MIGLLADILSNDEPNNEKIKIIKHKEIIIKNNDTNQKIDLETILQNDEYNDDRLKITTSFDLIFDDLDDEADWDDDDLDDDLDDDEII